jgi:hypothetical protein
VSFVVAVVVIKAFIGIVSRYGFGPFAWYRIVAARRRSPGSACASSRWRRVCGVIGSPPSSRGKPMILVSSFAMAAALAQAPAAPPPAPRSEPPAPRIEVRLEPPPPAAYPVPPRPSPPPPPYVIRVSPPPPLPTPSAAAHALALRLVERFPFFEQEARRAVISQLRWSGSDTCDFGSAPCRRVAEEIAARETPRLVAEARDGASRVLGAQFDRSMSAAQIEEAQRFFSGDAGKALIGSFLAMNRQTFAAFEPAFSALSRRRDELAEEFIRRTRHLPRFVRPVPSAPPLSPAAAAAAAAAVRRTAPTFRPAEPFRRDSGKLLLYRNQTAHGRFTQRFQ